MVDTTPINALRLAELGDSPDLESAFADIGEDLDTRLIPRFANSGARDAAITAPVQGMYCDVIGTGLMRYSGSSWGGVAGAANKIAVKTSDESVTSSTAFQADDHLTVALAANTTYWIESVLVMTGHATGLFQGRFTFPAGCTVHQYTGNGTTPVLSDTTSPTATINITTSATITEFDLSPYVVIVGSTAGNFALEWAQQISNATATVVKTGSFLRAIVHG